MFQRSLVFQLVLVAAGFPSSTQVCRTFPCPVCQELFELPETGVDGLEPNDDVLSVDMYRGPDFCVKHDHIVGFLF